MIHQLDLNGLDMVTKAVERLRIFEPKEGYFLAFSGGKDSVVCKKLLDMAGVKYDAHYAITTVDPPELVRFIKREYPDVTMEKQHWESDGKFHKAGDPITMWNLIPEKQMPPTRIVRYCCSYLKEPGGHGRKIVTGVRWAESANRNKNQGLVTVIGKPKTVMRKAEDSNVNFTKTNKGGVVLNNDNDDTRDFVESCYKQAKTLVNPIIDWEDSDVWEFIHEYNVPYCELYDCGYKRLGCIGCPMNTTATEELDRYPKYKKLYVRAFDKMLEGYDEAEREKRMSWKTGEDVMKWWLQE